MTDHAWAAMLGPIGPAQVACLESWRRRRRRTLFLHTDRHALPGRLTRFVDAYVHLGFMPRVDADAAERIAGAIGHRDGTRLCAVGDQPTLGLWRWLHPLRDDVTIMASPAEVIEAMESKRLQAALAEDCGFRVLPTAALVDAVDAERAGLRFPLVLRPDRASLDSGFKAVAVDSADALDRFLRARRTGAPPVVAQPFVSGPNLVIHGARNAAGEQLAWQGYLVRMKNAGVTVTLEPCAVSADVAAACSRFAGRAGLVGAFHFDLLVEPGAAAPCFLEVNARLGGTTAKVFASGYDEPAALLWAFGLAAAPTAEAGAVRVVNRMAAARCVLQALRGGGDPIDYPFPQRTAVLAGAARAMLSYRDEVLRPTHPLATMVFFSQYLHRSG